MCPTTSNTEALIEWCVPCLGPYINSQQCVIWTRHMANKLGFMAWIHWVQWTQSRKAPVTGNSVTRWLRLKMLRNGCLWSWKCNWLEVCRKPFWDPLPWSSEWSSSRCRPVLFIYTDKMKSRWVIWQQGILLFLIKANKKTISLLKRCILKAFYRLQMCAPSSYSPLKREHTEKAIYMFPISQ